MMFSEFLDTEEVYRVAGEFRRRKLDIRLHYDPEIVRGIVESVEVVFDRVAKSSSLLEIQMTYEHELTHWYQQIGTAYGYFQLSADDCSARHVSAFFEHYRSIQPTAPYPHPIQPWIFRGWNRRIDAFRKHVQRGGDLTSYLRSVKKDPRAFALNAMLLNRAIELCEGGENTSELITTILYSQLWRSLSANLDDVDPKILSGLESLANERPSLIANARAGVPSIPGYGTIGAWHIAEGQAHFIELSKISMLVHQRRVPNVLDSYVRDAGSRDYRVAFEYFQKLVSARALSPTDVLVTFLCVCDLALSTPIHPIFFEIAHALRWTDLHPGWRFIRLCKAVRELGTVGTETTSLEPELYRSFIGKMCANLSWPSPLQMADHFMKQDRVKLTEPLTSNLFAAASIERLKNPTAFALYLFEDEPRAQSLMNALPRPPVVIGDEDDPRILLPYWGESDENHRLWMMRDFLRLSDAYHLVDSLLYDDSDLATLAGLQTGSVDELLQRNFGVSLSDFRRRDRDAPSQADSVG